MPLNENDIPNKQRALVLQGRGALGAYEAGINPQFEHQLTHGIVPLLILTHNGRQVQHLKNVRVIVKSTDFQRSMVESHLEEVNDLADFTRQVMVFEYEEVR
jgi:hypothetical protein